MSTEEAQKVVNGRMQAYVRDGQNNIEAEHTPTTSGKGWRFWAVFPAICVTTMLTAVESTVVSTALPFIVHELDAGDLYVWFVNVYFLTR
jgi:hypothetical protein